MAVRHPYLDLPGPWLVAHRGASDVAPENTLPAFDRAAALGADALEIDVHRSADGVVFVFHDDDTGRITGVPGTVEARTAAEVGALDAGFAFTPDGGKTFPFRGAGVRIPTLAEVLARYPSMRLSIDAKSADAALARSLAKVISGARAEARVVVGSFLDVQARRLGRLLPGVCRYLPRRAAAWHVLCARLRVRPPWAPAYQLAALPRRHGPIEVVTPALVKHLHACGIPVHVWTIDDEAEMRELLALGVDGIITNRPGVLKKVLGR